MRVQFAFLLFVLVFSATVTVTVTAATTTTWVNVSAWHTGNCTGAPYEHSIFPVQTCSPFLGVGVLVSCVADGQGRLVNYSASEFFGTGCAAANFDANTSGPLNTCTTYNSVIGTLYVTCFTTAGDNPNSGAMAAAANSIKLTLTICALIFAAVTAAV